MKKLLFLALFCASSWIFTAGDLWGADVCVSSETDFQDALDDAEVSGENDVIKVVMGTYYGNFLYTSSQGNSITLLGGYTSGCTDRLVDPENTVLDAEGSGRVLQLYHTNGGDISVDGFTIQNGDFSNVGGGVYTGSQATAGIAGNINLTNNIIRDNDAGLEGGGIYARSYSESGTAGYILIQDNLVTGNASDSGYSGGGIWAHSSSASGSTGTVTLINNTVKGNTSGYRGGGIYALSSSETGFSSNVNLTNNTIQNNTSMDSGGGAYARSQSTLSTAGHVTFTSNTVVGNSSGSFGGGVLAYSRSISDMAGNVTLTNNIIAGNTTYANAGGGAYASSVSDSVAISGGTVTLTNNTITGNTSASGGGGLFTWRDNNTTNCYNNIIWGNTAGSGGDDIYLGNTGTANGYNNDYDPSALVGSWTSAGNNINLNPKLSNSSHLRPGSPCIDTGNNSPPSGLSGTDIDGDSRIIKGIVDIGADEFLPKAISQFLLLLLN